MNYGSISEREPLLAEEGETRGWVTLDLLDLL